MVNLNNKNRTEINDYDNQSQNEIIINTHMNIDIEEENNIKNIIELNDKHILVHTKKGRLMEFQRINGAAETFKENFYKYNNKIEVKQELSENSFHFQFKEYNLQAYNNINKNNIINIPIYDEDLNNYVNSHSIYQAQSNAILNDIKKSENIYNEIEQSQILINNSINNNSLIENQFNQNSKLEQSNDFKKEELMTKEVKKEETNIREIKKEEAIKENEEKKENKNIEQNEVYKIKKGVVDFGFPFACKHPLTEEKITFKYKKKNLLY